MKVPRWVTNLLAGGKIGPGEFTVLSIVCGQTHSWNRDFVSLTLCDLARRTNMSESTARRKRDGLIEKGFLEKRTVGSSYVYQPLAPGERKERMEARQAIKSQLSQ